MWDDLRSYAASIEGRSLLGLFDNPNRAETFSREADGLYFDFSKTQVDETALGMLLTLAADVPARAEAMFTGAKINDTEGRAVLHTALRAPGGPIEVDGADAMPEVLATKARMAEFARTIRASDITDVVNIGIGGSDLGPAMATLALAPYHDGPRLHYVSNVDGAHINDTLQELDPKRTLVVVASKTFTTIETMTNAKTARDWMAKEVADTGPHFAALSSATDKTGAFGIPEAHVFGFEDWVGGRYSLWGPIGLGLMLAVGPEAFDDFLTGGHTMDTHFSQAPKA